ncbi:MAG: hypothetical protein ACJ8HQ_00870 [Chthoniobacterales bacterium]
MLQSLDTAIAFVVIMTVASLFVTVIVQMCSAALSLRGKNLANALALSFQRIDPRLRGEAHQLAARILSDPLLSDSTRTVKDIHAAMSVVERCKPWHFTDVLCATQLASAVRPEEVYLALQRLSTHTPATHGWHDPNGRIKSTAQKVLDALVVPESEAAEIQKRLEPFRSVANEIPDAAVKQRLLDLVGNTPANLLVEIDAARLKFEDAFRTAQDRAQQWFQLHARGLTIAASAVLALVLQLDVVEIYRFVSTNAVQRAALVGNATNVIKDADGAVDARGGLVKRIADAWAEKTGQHVDLSQIVHTGQLEDTLAKANPQFDRDEFERVVKETTQTYFEDQRNKLTDLTREVSATGFEFFPGSYWRWPSPAGRRASLHNVVTHLPGIALCAALLSLGAPYWYNLLKNLTSLRPALAQLIGQEEKRVPAPNE